MDTRIRMLNEYYNREVKYMKVYDSFRANYTRRPVTCKFYSKYELNDLSKADPHIVTDVRFHMDYPPKQKHEFPETVNQEYGWMVEPLVPPMRDDNRFYHPVKTADFIKHEFRVIADGMNTKNKFTGTPFFLQ